MSHSQPPLRLGAIALVFLAYVSCPRDVLGHHPIFTDDAATTPETAIVVKDPQISQVVYREISKENAQMWLSFTVPENFKLFIQIGVPVIDRLKDFRPAMVVIGPGLPDKHPPFEIPKDMGAKVFTTGEVEKPRFFHEHFTGTDSWILRSETIALPKAGRYYLAGYSPQGQAGKLWLSVGRKESFSLADLMQFPTWTKKIQKFHEVKGK